jgi:hypothetical protein
MHVCCIVFAVYCSVLQCVSIVHGTSSCMCVAVCCGVLRCVAVFAVCCSVFRSCMRIAHAYIHTYIQIDRYIHSTHTHIGGLEHIGIYSGQQLYM